jgi:hypothetical protein
MKHKLLFKNHLKTFFLLAFFVTGNFAFGQIVAFNNTWSGITTTANATTTDSNLGTVTLSRGSGLAASSNTTRINSNNFAPGTTLILANIDYYTFTLTANSGYFINLNSSTLSISLGSSPTGPQSYGIYSNVGGFTSTANQIGSNLTASTSQTITFPSSGYNNLSSIEIRIYGWNASATGGTGGIASLSLSGTVATPAITWDGTAWSNTTGPDATTQATIAGVYSTSTNGTFTAKNVVIQSGSLTINSGTNLTIQDGVENQLTETAFVIEDNANLIQTNALATNFGSATVKTNSAPMVRLDYTAWASPVIAQKLKAFSPQTLDARFYTYDPVTNAYAVVATPVTTNLETGVGYLIRASDVSSPTVASSYNAQFIGIPVNGTKTTPVSIGFNLLGNPYASKLDAATFLTNANTTALGISTLHFWTHTVAAVGGIYPANNYASYNATGGTAAAAGGATPDGRISVGQGFFVNPTSAGNVTFNNTMRTTTVSTQFFKSAFVVNTPSDKHRFWLNLTTPTTANNQILIGYVADAGNDFDAKYDAALFGNTASVIYSKVADYKLAIQGRSSFAITDVLPLGLQATEAGQFTISLADFDGLFVSQNIFLKDNVLNTIQNLKLGSYTFNATQGEFASRFEVVFESVALATNTNVFNEASVIVIKNNNGILIETGNNTIEKVAIYDIRGRLLLTKTNINASTVTLNNVATGRIQ